jgi:hypothetical protein
LDKQIKKEIGGDGKKPQDFFDIVHAPYVEGFSKKVQRLMRKFHIGM